MTDRDRRLAAALSGDPPDVLIVGGGINGVGLFRELALQGVKVLLVEKGDFCSGSSAAPGVTSCAAPGSTSWARRPGSVAGRRASVRTSTKVAARADRAFVRSFIRTGPFSAIGPVPGAIRGSEMDIGRGGPTVTG